jgi:hypothetical protein
MYTDTNFKSKKELKDAVASGARVTYFQPGPFGGNAPQTGKIYVEGPHYPKPHKWYAECFVRDGVIIAVK